MSYIDDYDRMNELESFYGNRFEAIIQVSNCARSEVDKSYRLMSSSQALTYVLSKKLPEKFGDIQYNDHFTYADYLIRQVEDDLLLIYNKDIREAVRCSLYKSFKFGHLIYDYKNVESESQRKRVRVRCKMLRDKVLKMSEDL